MTKINIHPNIDEANTLPASFYREKSFFEASKEQIFAKTWQFVGDTSKVSENRSVYPFTLLENVLDEPLVLTRQKEDIHCLSNVCTHRGKIIVEKEGKTPLLSCKYHGRCFSLDGKFKRMPEFQKAKNFPTEKDNLASVSVEEMFGLLFVNLDPSFSFEDLMNPIKERLGFLDFDKLKYREELSKSYQVDANWALYCDNYLEGLHVPFVHPALNEALDWSAYEYHTFDYCNLQVGIASEGQHHFDLPEGHPDYGKKIYAYYFWLFPNMMLNFYPWGLSFNYIRPKNHKETEVVFRTYELEGNTINFADFEIDATELEDEAVVQSVQKGVQSRFYESGRFSPTMEVCVHHFHQLVAKFLNK